jgi:hypothetical protein
MRAGDLDGAARQYGEAARVAATVENVDAVAANSINQSIVYQWMGRDADARDALSRVLDDPRRPFPERRRLQAELRRAIVDLALQNPVSAATFAERAEKRCPNLSCEYAVHHPQRPGADRDRGLARRGRRAACRPRRRARPLAQRPRRDSQRPAHARQGAPRCRKVQGSAAAARAGARHRPRPRRSAQDPRRPHRASLASSAAGNRDAAKDYYERA